MTRSTVANDLVDAIGEGIANAAALIGAPAPLGTPAVQDTDNADRDTAMEQHLPAPGTTLKTIIDDVNHLVSQGSSAVRPDGRQLTPTTDQTHQTRAAVKSVIGDGRTTIRSAFNGNGSPAATTTEKKTPVRDAVKNARNDIKKVITKVSDRHQKGIERRQKG